MSPGQPSTQVLALAAQSKAHMGMPAQERKEQKAEL